MNPFKDFKLVDLTQTLDENIATWTGGCGFKREILMDFPEGARVLEYKCIGSAGTHIDAPFHFVPNGRAVDQLTLEELCVPICVMDMSEELHANARITLEDFKNYEKAYGAIPKGSVVLGHTGWCRHWKSPKIYRGEKELPVCPCFNADVGELLIEREIAGIGIDTLSPDSYEGDYPLHVALLGSDKFILENLTNLDKLPKKGSYLIALPLKIAEGSESPVRAIALVANNGE